MLAMVSIDSFTDSAAILKSIFLTNMLWIALWQMRTLLGHKFGLGIKKLLSLINILFFSLSHIDCNMKNLKEYTNYQEAMSRTMQVQFIPVIDRMR